MGTVVCRVSRGVRRFYGKYKEADGRWTMRALKGARTKEEARRLLLAAELRVSEGRLGLHREEGHLCGEFLDRWGAGLFNRSNKDDRSVIKHSLKPFFGGLSLHEACRPKTVLQFLEWEASRVPALAESTRSQHLHQLSRFFGWLILHEYAEMNPVTAIPRHKRPHYRPDRSRPWIRDDGTVLRILEVAPEPFGLMVYLGNRSGLRPGELCGLRLNDVSEELRSHGCIRVCHTYDQPGLKESKDPNALKFVPCPSDFDSIIGPYLRRRLQECSSLEEPLFVSNRYRKRPKCLKHANLDKVWSRVREALKLPERMRLYDATRASYINRCMAAGAGIEAVQQAVNHSSHRTTQLYMRAAVELPQYPALLRAPLGQGPDVLQAKPDPLPKPTDPSK